MSKESADEENAHKNDDLCLTSKINEMESNEESLLNSIVEAVMRGDMNQVVTLALSHRSSDQKVKTMVDQALSSAMSKKALHEKKQNENYTDESDTYSQNIVKSIENVTLDSSISKSPNSTKQNCTESSITSQNVIYSQRTPTKSKESNEGPCTYYYSNDPIISSNCTSIDSNSNTALYCQSGYAANNTDIDSHPDDSLNNTLSQYQITNSSLQNVETINTLSMSQQSVQVQLPGIGNFLLQIPSNFKPGEPITLPLNLPLTPVSQTSGVNPISIHMNTGQLMSNQLLSLYNPSSNINITAGKKMRAIAPKPSKPTYRQPLIAPKTSSPNASTINQDGLNISSTPLPAPSGPGRRKGNKGKKSGRKKGAPAKSHKNSSYASSTHSMDSQDASQYNETSSMKQNCNNPLSTRGTYQCNYYVNNDSSDYLNQSHVTISQSYNEINSNTLLDNSDSGEKDLLSLAWEISNAELGNTDDFNTAYNLYDANNLGADGFVSSEILDQFLQNIQKDDMAELSRCSSTQINIDSRVSYSSSFTTLPPCSTVLPSVTTSTYLNNYSNNSSNIELPQCIEIAEVVNLNTEDMLSELEKEENALLDKFVAQYGAAHQNELIRCDSQTVIPETKLSSTDCNELMKNNNSNKDIDSNNHHNTSNEESEKDLDLNVKESNELSEIAKQIEISCSSSHQDIDFTIKPKIYTIPDTAENFNKIESFSKIISNNTLDTNFSNNGNNINFCNIPNTSLELIYSTNPEPTLIDDKTQCLVSVNFDSKRSSESSFYITDSSLKSKTLDDFGLFEFCTDGEISLNVKSINHESLDIIDDDNKYIEPPILEDISDATPIQSDNESEDEDIDYLAFKFSKFVSNFNVRQNKPIDKSQRLYYNEFFKDLPTIANLKENNTFTKILNDWYIGLEEIKMNDIFSTSNDLKLKENLSLNEKDNVKNPISLKCCKDPEFSNDIISINNGNETQNKMFIINDKSNDEYTEQLHEIDLTNQMENNKLVCIDLKERLISLNETEEIQTVLELSQSQIDNENEKVYLDCGINIPEEKNDNNILIVDKRNLNNDETTVVKINELIKNIVKTKEKTFSQFKRKRKTLVPKNDYETLKNLSELKIYEKKEKLSKSKTSSHLNSVHERQRRLRKPPKKLAIYQSINFIEKEFSTEHIEKLKTKKKLETLEIPISNTEFKRCTRSKGTILKSFDSFYEAISRHKMSSNSKNRISRKNISNDNSIEICIEKSPTERFNDNEVDVDVIDNSLISYSSKQTMEKYQINELVPDLIFDNKAVGCFSSIDISPTTKNCINIKKCDYKKSNIIRKYNLRKNALPIKNEEELIKSSTKHRKNKFKTVDIALNCFSSSNSEIRNKLTKHKNTKIENHINDLAFKENIENHAILQNHIDEYDNIDFYLNSLELKAIVTESLNDNFLYPSVEFKTLLKSTFVQNKFFMNYTNDSEINMKKIYPVRKINRKLRRFSGLEIVINDKNVKYASLIDMNSREIPSRFQCCSQFANVSSVCSYIVKASECNSCTIESFYSEIQTQNLVVNEDSLISDTDDVESFDAPLVIVEIEEVSNSSSNFKKVDYHCEELATVINEDESIAESSLNTDKNPIIVEKSERFDIFKKYSLRPKRRQINNLSGISTDKKDFIPQKLKRSMFNRACKMTKSYKNNSMLDSCGKIDIINNINLRTPICTIEKLSPTEIANLSKSPILVINDELLNLEKSNLENSPLKFIKKMKISNTNSNYMIEKNLKSKDLNKLEHKIFKKKKPQKKNNIYAILKKSIWRKTVNRKFNCKFGSKRKVIVKCFHNYSDDLKNLDNNVKLIEEGIAQIIIQSKDYTSDMVDNDDNESINVGNDSPNDQFNTYLDSNNVETFSRNYGSFSLKIKVQKKDPAIIEVANNVSKKHKKNSKKRKKLRHFLSSIIGSSDGTFNKSNLSDDLGVVCTKISKDISTDKKRKNRKRKYSINRDETYSDVYNTNNDFSESLNYERPPQLSPESVFNDESQYQKPIKIKLFKSTSEDLTKSEGSSFHSEKIVFSLQKSESSDIKEFNKTANQKILQIVQDIPSKPCRQAANLAKKKIFSTAKEDRRSQNATLSSIWNSKKLTNGTNKATSDILTIYQNDRGKRPRGRPPKLGQSLFITEKQASSTGTLKLKIKLSKDFKNCNNDSHSSNGENSGRTSTNDSSILNSAVAGINGPSDALSLESNNFINGITEQLDQNIEYLEAKEAKVYFDPNQVDIEKIKNSYYSSKKSDPESFNIESQQRVYENSINEISNKKSSNLSTNRNFSQYGDLDSVEVSSIYNSILSKENVNNKMSHLSKDNMNISDNCYTNILTNREPQNLSSNQSFQFDNQLSSPGKNPPEAWQNSKTNSSDSSTSCRNNNSSWFSDHRNVREPSFPISNSILYNPYMTSPVKETKNCLSQNPNQPFLVCENENPDSKLIQRSPSKRSTSSEGRKSGSNSFSINESHNQLSPHYSRGGIGSVPSQLNIHPWSDEPNHNASLNHTAAAWMTYAQQQAAAAAYMDPQMKAYYNLALSQSMLNNPYCGSYGNPANSENFYTSLHSQYLNNSKDTNEKMSITNGGVRNHNDPMGSFMEAAQMSSWEHFYSAAAMAGYHNSSQGSMDDYAGRAGNMLQAHHMLANGYPGSMLGRDHFTLDNNKPPLAHQNQSGSTSPIKLTASSSTPVSSSQAYSHVQMPYSHFSGTPVGFF